MNLFCFVCYILAYPTMFSGPILLHCLILSYHVVRSYPTMFCGPILPCCLVLSYHVSRSYPTTLSGPTQPQLSGPILLF